MLAEKQLKPIPELIFMARLIKFGKWLATPPPTKSSEHSDWYAGLCVDPSGFSDQLGKLENSLRPAGISVESKPRT